MQGLFKAHNTTHRSILVMTFFVAKNRKVPSSCSSLLKASVSPGKYLKWEVYEKKLIVCINGYTASLLATRKLIKYVLCRSPNECGVDPVEASLRSPICHH